MNSLVGARVVRVIVVEDTTGDGYSPEHPLCRRLSLFTLDGKLLASRNAKGETEVGEAGWHGLELGSDK